MKTASSSSIVQHRHAGFQYVVFQSEHHAVVFKFQRLLFQPERRIYCLDNNTAYVVLYKSHNAT